MVKYWETFYRRHTALENLFMAQLWQKHNLEADTL